MTYRLVAGANEGELTKLVNKYLSQDWKLYGDTFVVKTKRTGGGYIIIFYQPMIKESTAKGKAKISS